MTLDGAGPFQWTSLKCIIGAMTEFDERIDSADFFALELKSPMIQRMAARNKQYPGYSWHMLRADDGLIPIMPFTQKRANQYDNQRDDEHNTYECILLCRSKGADKSSNSFGQTSMGNDDGVSVSRKRLKGDGSAASTSSETSNEFNVSFADTSGDASDTAAKTDTTSEPTEYIVRLTKSRKQ